MVEYQGVYKAFDVPVLAGVDLTVATGETLAIVGHSGTGKSVLLKHTIGLIHPDAGDVLIDGESVFRTRGTSLERIRRKVGYVFQNAALFDSMDVEENVLHGIPEAELRALSHAESLRRVEEALEHVNLDPGAILGKIPSELSGGMRKRVGLARAIIGKPEILLYDEPVTGLDPVNGTVVHRLIAALAEEMGVTSIIVTHDIEGVLPIADRIALLDKGVVRWVGTPAEFCESDDALVRAFLHREIPTEELLEVV
ncbi:MAG: ATP-binding cassette domain-containing protein [Gemmatimonadota bacterium]|jgi:phospholipid/cholesterol/gamma-HCH transport system ATP-binding protein|nr:ATP-binding cassette domain-containing protein [Gemmatimonadota bacterium]